MRLDYDLIRDLLLLIEDKSDGKNEISIFRFTEAMPDTDIGIIEYHLKYLSDAGVIEMYDGYVMDLTPIGHDYANNMRNDTVWKHAKEKLHPVGSAALDVIGEVVKAVLLAQIGL